MGRNQPESLTKSTSPYRNLYNAIDNMLNHEDHRLVALAHQLKDHLDRFEKDPMRCDNNVKRQFQSIFVTALHSHDEQFSTQRDVKKIIHGVHIQLYTDVFSNNEHLRKVSFFPQKEEQDTEQHFPPRP